MDAEGHHTTLGARAGQICRGFWFLLIILFLQWIPYDERAFCENLGEHSHHLLAGTNIRDTGETCAEQHYKQHIIFGSTGEPPRGRQNTSGGVSIILRSRVFQRRNVSRVYSPLKHCKAGLEPCDCEGAIWMCAPLLSTCTLNRKSRHNKSGISAFGGMWKISFQNFHTGVFPCYVWTPMHMLALDRGLAKNGELFNQLQLGLSSPNLKITMGGCYFPCWKISIWQLQTPSFDVGATYYGPPPRRHVTRIDYICVPESCLQKVSRCHVQYMAADSLQLICDCARRDHVPLQIEIDLQLEFAGVAANTRKTWDAEPPCFGCAGGQAARGIVQCSGSAAGDACWYKYNTRRQTLQP